ncbi:MAG: glycosyltransferase family 39 protein [Desulfobacterales bacterium]|nr:glycosyltransferase family 39 protein [Desulfobacterales bacterium]
MAGALLVDLPDVNLPLGRLLRLAGVRVVQAVAPQTWAWRAGRNRLLRASCDMLAVILPFEEPYFRSRGCAVRFVGHPLVDRLAVPAAAADGAPAVPALAAGAAAGQPPGAGARRAAAAAGGRPPSLRGGGELERVVGLAGRRRDRRGAGRAAGAARRGSPCRCESSRAAPLAWLASGEPGEPPVRQAWVAAGTGSLEVAALGIPACVAWRTNRVGFARWRAGWCAAGSPACRTGCWSVEALPERLQDELTADGLVEVFAELRRPSAPARAAASAGRAAVAAGRPRVRGAALARLVDEVVQAEPHRAARPGARGRRRCPAGCSARFLSAWATPRRSMRSGAQSSSRAGYLDHPPLIGWLDAAVLTLWSSPLALRALALGLFSLSAWLLFRLARELFDEAAAWIAVALLCAAPVFHLGGLAASPDAPLSPLWLGTLWVGWRAWRRARRRRGAVVGLGGVAGGVGRRAARRGVPGQVLGAGTGAGAGRRALAAAVDQAAGGVRRRRRGRPARGLAGAGVEPGARLRVGAAPVVVVAARGRPVAAQSRGARRGTARLPLAGGGGAAGLGRRARLAERVGTGAGGRCGGAGRAVDGDPVLPGGNARAVRAAGVGLPVEPRGGTALGRRRRTRPAAAGRGDGGGGRARARRLCRRALGVAVAFDLLAYVVVLTPVLPALVPEPRAWRSSTSSTSCTGGRTCRPRCGGGCRRAAWWWAGTTRTCAQLAWNLRGSGVVVGAGRRRRATSTTGSRGGSGSSRRRCCTCRTSGIPSGRRRRAARGRRNPWRSWTSDAAA